MQSQSDAICANIFTRIENPFEHSFTNSIGNIQNIENIENVNENVNENIENVNENEFNVIPLNIDEKVVEEDIEE